MHYEIHYVGSIDRQMRIDTKAYRKTAAMVPPEGVPSNVLEQMNLAPDISEGQFTFAGVANCSENLTGTADFKLGGVDRPGSSALEAPADFRGDEHVSTRVRHSAAANKGPCVTGGVETLAERCQIVLPRQMKIVALPKPFIGKNEVSSYEATVRQGGQTITPKLVDLYAGPVMAASPVKDSRRSSRATCGRKLFTRTNWQCGYGSHGR